MKNTYTSFLFYILFTGWLLSFVFMGISMLKQAPEQIGKDNYFIKHEINPNIALIDSFKQIHSRLPTVNEFNALNHRGNVDYIREEKFVDNDIIDEAKGINWSDNYVLWVWRGEWSEYYISSSHKYITNGYSIWDGRIGMLVCVIFGLIPWVIFLVIRDIKNRKLRHQTTVV